MSSDPLNVVRTTLENLKRVSSNASVELAISNAINVVDIEQKRSQTSQQTRTNSVNQNTDLSNDPNNIAELQSIVRSLLAIASVPVVINEKGPSITPPDQTHPNQNSLVPEVPAMKSIANSQDATSNPTNSAQPEPNVQSPSTPSVDKPSLQPSTEASHQSEPQQASASVDSVPILFTSSQAKQFQVPQTRYTRALITSQSQQTNVLSNDSSKVPVYRSYCKTPLPDFNRTISFHDHSTSIRALFPITKFPSFITVDNSGIVNVWDFSLQIGVLSREPQLPPDAKPFTTYRLGMGPPKARRSDHPSTDKPVTERFQQKPHPTTVSYMELLNLILIGADTGHLFLIHHALIDPALSATSQRTNYREPLKYPIHNYAQVSALWMHDDAITDIATTPIWQEFVPPHSELITTPLTAIPDQEPVPTTFATTSADGTCVVAHFVFRPAVELQCHNQNSTDEEQLKILPQSEHATADATIFNQFAFSSSGTQVPPSPTSVTAYSMSSYTQMGGSFPSTYLQPHRYRMNTDQLQQKMNLFGPSLELRLAGQTDPSSRSAPVELPRIVPINPLSQPCSVARDGPDWGTQHLRFYWESVHPDQYSQPQPQSSTSGTYARLHVLYPPMSLQEFDPDSPPPAVATSPFVISGTVTTAPSAASMTPQYPNQFVDTVGSTPNSFIIRQQTYSRGNLLCVQRDCTFRYPHQALQPFSTSQNCFTSPTQDELPSYPDGTTIILPRPTCVRIIPTHLLIQAEATSESGVQFFSRPVQASDTILALGYSNGDLFFCCVQLRQQCLVYRPVFINNKQLSNLYDTDIKSFTETAEKIEAQLRDICNRTNSSIPFLARPPHPVSGISRLEYSFERENLLVGYLLVGYSCSAIDLLTIGSGKRETQAPPQPSPPTEIQPYIRYKHPLITFESRFGVGPQQKDNPSTFFTFLRLASRYYNNPTIPTNTPNGFDSFLHTQLGVPQSTQFNQFSPDQLSSKLMNEYKQSTSKSLPQPTKSGDASAEDVTFLCASPILSISLSPRSTHFMITNGLTQLSLFKLEPRTESAPPDTLPGPGTVPIHRVNLTIRTTHTYYMDEGVISAMFHPLEPLLLTAGADSSAKLFTPKPNTTQPTAF